MCSNQSAGTTTKNELFRVFSRRIKKKFGCCEYSRVYFSPIVVATLVFYEHNNTKLFVKERRCVFFSCLEMEGLSGHSDQVFVSALNYFRGSFLSFYPFLTCFLFPKMRHEVPRLFSFERKNTKRTLFPHSR